MPCCQSSQEYYKPFFSLCLVLSFNNACEQQLEQSQRVQLSMRAISAWLSFRLQLLGVAVLAGVSVLALLQHNTAAISPGEARGRIAPAPSHLTYALLAWGRSGRANAAKIEYTHRRPRKILAYYNRRVDNVIESSLDSKIIHLFI